MDGLAPSIGSTVIQVTREPDMSTPTPRREATSKGESSGVLAGSELAQVQAACAEFGSLPGGLLPVLHAVQERLGWVAPGAVPVIAQALNLLQSVEAPDGAVLDVNLQGDYVFPVLDVLRDKRVPFVLATGYDGAALPTAYADAPRCEKPLDMRRLAGTLHAAIAQFDA